MDEYAREPCPWRIIDDCGGAFSMGLIGGSLFQMINGARNAPKGFSRRLKGGILRVKERAPIFGGQFAAWGICFSTFDCTFVHLRQKASFVADHRRKTKQRVSSYFHSSFSPISNPCGAIINI